MYYLLSLNHIQRDVPTKQKGIKSDYLNGDHTHFDILFSTKQHIITIVGYDLVLKFEARHVEYLKVIVNNECAQVSLNLNLFLKACRERRDQTPPTLLAALISYILHTRNKMKLNGYDSHSFFVVDQRSHCFGFSCHNSAQSHATIFYCGLRRLLSMHSKLTTVLRKSSERDASRQCYDNAAVLVAFGASVLKLRKQVRPHPLRNPYALS